MPDMTVQQIIDDAYYLNGKSSVDATISTRALRFLQNMLSSWSSDGLIAPYSVTENFTLTIGQAIYTIGVTADAPNLITVTGRPVRITNAYIRISNVDYAIETDMTKSEYLSISSKDTESRPTRLYYDPQYPNGKIKFNYEAASAYDFHLVSQKVLVSPTALTTTFSIPLEYNRAMVYNLAIELAANTVNSLHNSVYIIAEESLDAIKSINATDVLSDKIMLDNALTGRGASIDIYKGS